MKLTILLVIPFLLLGACNSGNKKEVKDIVSTWIGKTIEFPEDVKPTMSIDGSSIINYQDSTAQFKVLIYTDSVGCQDCKLNLPQWKYLISEADSIFTEKVRFLFYFQPKHGEEKELCYIFIHHDFDYPIFLDPENKLNQLNRFPDNMEYQTFLLDTNNQVVSIGNPTLHPKLWNLYKQIIIKSQSEIK